MDISNLPYLAQHKQMRSQLMHDIHDAPVFITNIPKAQAHIDTPSRIHQESEPYYRASSWTRDELSYKGQNRHLQNFTRQSFKELARSSLHGKALHLPKL